MQKDNNGIECDIYYKFRLLRAAKLNYHVYGKVLAVKYDVVKSRMRLLGTEPFKVYTDHSGTLKSHRTFLLEWIWLNPDIKVWHQ